MLAEKLADHIRARDPLPPSAAPFFEAAQWRTQQR
jgi:choline dehydrogenase